MEVSIVIATYNSQWDKLRETIDSILVQREVEFEVIFADDGSRIVWNEEIREYMRDRQNWCFAGSTTNYGTVINILNAVRVAKGDLIKVISPGDFFAEPDALRSWVDHMKAEQSDLSFCNAFYYYRDENGKKRNVIRPTAPRNLDLYRNRAAENRRFVDYLLANDTILGASVMVRRDVFLSYLQEMSGRVKYAEDYMIRIMVFDRRKISHLDRSLIFYEYGEGISTTPDNKWQQLLFKDFEATNAVIASRKNPVGKYQSRYQLLLKNEGGSLSRKVKKLVLFPSVLVYRMKMRYNQSMTTPFEEEPD